VIKLSLVVAHVADTLLKLGMKATGRVCTGIKLVVRGQQTCFLGEEQEHQTHHYRDRAAAVGLSADAELGLSVDADLARRAARALGTPTFGPMAARSGIGAPELARQALAWRHEGPVGLELLHREWDPVADEPESADLLEAARDVLRSKTGVAESVSANRVTAGRLQLRLGRDLRWYPYARSDGDWEPSGPPESDPAQAVAAL
jgi:hypothetical protein